MACHQNSLRPSDTFMPLEASATIGLYNGVLHVILQIIIYTNDIDIKNPWIDINY